MKIRQRAPGDRLQVPAGGAQQDRASPHEPSRPARAVAGRWCAHAVRPGGLGGRRLQDGHRRPRRPHARHADGRRPARRRRRSARPLARRLGEGQAERHGAAAPPPGARRLAARALGERRSRAPRLRSARRALGPARIALPPPHCPTSPSSARASPPASSRRRNAAACRRPASNAGPRWSVGARRPYASAPAASGRSSTTLRGTTSASCPRIRRRSRPSPSCRPRPARSWSAPPPTTPCSPRPARRPGRCSTPGGTGSGLPRNGKAPGCQCRATRRSTTAWPSSSSKGSSSATHSGPARRTSPRSRSGSGATSRTGAASADGCLPPSSPSRSAMPPP